MGKTEAYGEGNETGILKGGGNILSDLLKLTIM